MPALAQRVTNETRTKPFQSVEQAFTFCKRLCCTIDSLIDVLNSETQLLREMQIDRLEELHQPKSELMRTYLADIAILEASNVKLSDLVPDALRQLRDKHRRLRDAIMTNENVLATIKEISEKLIRKAAERADTLRRPATYSDPSQPSNTRSSAVPVSVNRQL